MNIWELYVGDKVNNCNVWKFCYLCFVFRFVPGGPPAGTRPVPSKPLPPPTRDIAAIKVPVTVL